MHVALDDRATRSRSLNAQRPADELGTIAHDAQTHARFLRPAGGQAHPSSLIVSRIPARVWVKLICTRFDLPCLRALVTASWAI